MPLTRTYTTGVGTLTFALYVPDAEAVSSERSAQFVETDAGSAASSGTLAMQVPASFTEAAIAGSFAFGLTGSAYVIGGTPPPVFVSGELWLTAAGARTASYTTELRASLEHSSRNGHSQAPSSSTARITLSLNGPDAGGENHLVGYVVGGTQVYLMSIDPLASFPLLSGTASRQ